MSISLKNMLVTIGLTASLGFAGCAKAGPARTPDKTEVEAIVKAYILEHPEIIEEALIKLEDKRNKASILAVKDELWHDKRDVSIGPETAKVTLVEFFDYNCTFCKHSTSWVQEVLSEHPKDVRVIFKELPILDRRTRTSRNASKAALAAARQGKYREMHFALMDGTALTDSFIEATAKKLGLDMDRFKKDMASEEIAEHLEDNIFLAQRIPGLSGTPFFVIGTDFKASGDTQALQRMLEKNLAQAK